MVKSRAAASRLLARLLLLLVAAAVHPAPVTAAAPVEFGRYHALIIGNNDYQHLPKLKTAVNDATEMAELLREKYGHSVTLLKNATRADILRALNGLRAELTQEDNLLIYYAGHGTLDRATDTGYWLPVDAEADSDLNWVANEAISRHLLGMTAQHVMVISDSCYSGTLVRDAQASPKTGTDRHSWLARVVEKRSRTAITSGGLEPVVDGGGKGHSVFAAAFLEALRANEGILEGSALFGQVSHRVVVGADQTPAYADIRKAGHEGGEFVFVPRGQVLVPQEANPRGASATDSAANGGPDAGGAALEVAFWQSIQNSTSAPDIEAYLSRFPDGTFAGLARNRLAALARPQDTASRAGTGRAGTGGAGTGGGGTAPAGAAGVGTARLAAGDALRDCESCPEMVAIAPGTVAMGTDAAEPEARAAEGPRRTVTVARPFALGKFEVSRAEFKAFAEAEGGVRDGACTVWTDGGWQERMFGWQYPDFEQPNSHPVVCVSWRTADRFAKWLSRKTGQRYRLPSEAEWEYAARAGVASPRPWGFDADEACEHANGADLTLAGDYWFEGRLLHGCRDDHARTAPVGSFRPNAFGLHDMLGNVAEWTADCWADTLAGGPDDGSPRQEPGCRSRTVRGGGWADGPLALRVAARRSAAFDGSQAAIGFRLARDLDEPVAPAPQRVATAGDAAGLSPDMPLQELPLPEMRALAPATFVVVADAARRAAPTANAPTLGTMRVGHVATATAESVDGRWIALASDGVSLGHVGAESLAAVDAGYIAPGFAAGQMLRDCAECPELVVVPPGRFALGGHGESRTITIPRAFAIGRFEVTFDEWAPCVADGACRDARDNGWGRGSRPAIGLHWYHALSYVRWLSAKTGHRYRLPSEAEWEYAARAGTGADRFWGEDLAESCRFANVADRDRPPTDDAPSGHPCADGFAETAPVGSFQPNGFGLHDMLGNAAEWVDDCWDEAVAAATAFGAPRRAPPCGQRLLRGGSAASGPAAAQAGYRGQHLNAGLSGGTTDTYAGVRVVRDLD